MSENHKLYHYSATCKTDDPVVLHCLRAICQFVEKGKYPQIGWGGTTRKSWAKNKNTFTVRFTSPNYRQTFFEEARRLLPSESWMLITTDDNDPASPRR
jgi:hypothetical protein